MEELHRRILVTKRQDIMNNIASPLDVADALYASGVLTSNLLEEVKAENVRHKQVRALLDILPMRGPTAFDLFYDALVKTYNGSAADLLKPGLQRTELPRTWIDESEVSQPVNVKLCDIKSYLITKYWKSPDVYSMKQRTRGRCVIISNENFVASFPPRKGSDKDVIKLKELFEQLSFKVEVYKDLFSKEIYERLSDEAKHPDHKNADCFVLVICSQGAESGIYGTDLEIVELNTILTQFNAQNCIHLAFKPKLIFLQVCQGDRLDECVIRFESEGILSSGTAHRKETTSRPAESGGKSSQNLQDMELVHIHGGKGGEIDETTHEACPEQNEIQSIPSTADFLIARASQPGFMSFRNVQSGTWFIQAIVWVFQRYAYDREIHQLLILVNRLVAKGNVRAFNAFMQDKKQMPRFDSSLQKMFFFFPGVFAAETPTETE